MPAPPPRPPSTKRRFSPALIAVIAAVVLALGGVAYAVTQSGGGESASSGSSSTDSSSDSSTDSSSDSSSDSTFSSSSLTDDDATGAAEQLVNTLFRFGPDDVGSVQSQLEALTFGSLREQVSSDNNEFVSSVQDNGTFSTVSISNSTVRVNDGDTAAVLVTFVAEVQDTSGSSSSATHDLAFLIVLEKVDGVFLAAELVDCSDGSSSAASDFSRLGSAASC